MYTKVLQVHIYNIIISTLSIFSFSHPPECTCSMYYRFHPWVRVQGGTGGTGKTQVPHMYVGQGLT